MSKEDIDLEDDFISDDLDDTEEAEKDGVKNSLAKRRVIDNILEERRLNKQIADFDFDIS
ncbi:PA3496 family putative envelope integrity protein [Entomomonas moraniae]